LTSDLYHLCVVIVMEFFVDKNSIVRTIWGKSDTVLFIFAGSAAEFALNKAVDWLYFTGRLPADPIGRLFSTVGYAKRIIFSEKQEAFDTIDQIASIHNAIENKREDVIPDWAYRDVLFMLIYYSIASFELLERKLTDDEKEEVYQVFYRTGSRMKLKQLPANYNDWLVARKQHLQNDLQRSEYTLDLFRQYKKHLGAGRYKILVESQLLVVPDQVKELLEFRKFSLLKPAVPVYKLIRKFNLDSLVKAILLPPAYKKEIKELDIVI
jgi:ER-bound oxygenase mpaB/B'/Rubber oxygenase, catalytic domain